MAEIVNLRRAKKQRNAATRDADAQQKRILHGRTKGEKLRDRLEQQQSEARAENACLDPNKNR